MGDQDKISRVEASPSRYVLRSRTVPIQWNWKATERKTNNQEAADNKKLQKNSSDDDCTFLCLVPVKEKIPLAVITLSSDDDEIQEIECKEQIKAKEFPLNRNTSGMVLQTKKCKQSAQTRSKTGTGVSEKPLKQMLISGYLLKKANPQREPPTVITI